MQRLASAHFGRLALAFSFFGLLAPAGAAAPAHAERSAAPVHASPAHTALVTRRALTLEAARAALAAAMRLARELGTTGVVAIVDEGGNPLLLERLDGTFPAGAKISIGKARTAALFKKPTRVFEEIIKGGRTPMVALDDFTPLQGGIPLVVDGHIVGGIGVSGASSASQDEDLAIAGANALAVTAADRALVARPSRALEPGTLLFSGDQVRQAFAAGKPLIETESYKIHASRREGPGKAEIHELDTDIAYIMEGSATLVTGGTAVEAKQIAPNEIRGESIRGGHTHQVSKGDVVVIPKGMPHWFKNVSSPFTYYVVKVH
jgi:uncharacterized protein GlcG (DUF336 family)/mannose-6-phosphate isomerase-like protein (cupin superfamily)